ncbi:hypothetical protein BJY52DRAFT_1133861 [Lactarius psammicola]|nr:hypothetical protein BJY52DRAFT_1133861 [Lactarius psammicola]
MLLHRNPSSLLHKQNGDYIANICGTCSSYLSCNKTPPLSLANTMWIGDIPLELKILTLPECVLITRHFPATYIVKLYPKKKGAKSWASTGLHSGIRGNVSTYHLNTDEIAKITTGEILPHPSSILAATIGVTFVGPQNLPEKTMPGFLRVNRVQVQMALQWLKQNNPIYHDITISMERLNALPMEGVPIEISSLAKHSNNTIVLDMESDGYVPDDTVDEEG